MTPPLCAPTPQPGPRRGSRWRTSCTAARRRIVRIILGGGPYVLIEVRRRDSGRMAMRVRSGGGVNTPTQIRSMLHTAIDAIEGKESDHA